MKPPMRVTLNLRTLVGLAGRGAAAMAWPEEFDPDWTVHPGALLREWCEENNATQGWLAEQVGISEPYMSQIINGRRTYSATLCVKLAKVTGMPVRFLWRFQSNYVLDVALGKTVVS